MNNRGLTPGGQHIAAYRHNAQQQTNAALRQVAMMRDSDIDTLSADGAQESPPTMIHPRYRMRIVIEQDRAGEWEEREDRIVSGFWTDEPEAIVDLRWMHRTAERQVARSVEEDR